MFNVLLDKIKEATAPPPATTEEILGGLVGGDLSVLDTQYSGTSGYLGEIEQPRVAGYEVPAQRFTTDDFYSYVNNLNAEDLYAWQRAAWADGLYPRGTDLTQITDPTLMLSAFIKAKDQAEAYAALRPGEATMIPTLGQRFIKYQGMSDEQLIAALISRGGGGGGGGAAVRLPDPAALNETLTAASSQVLGRTATDAEKRMFVEGINAAVRAGESVSVQARAREFAREQAPVEAGAMDLKNAGNLVLRALGMG